MLSIKQLVSLVLVLFLAYYWQTKIVRSPVYKSDKDLTGKTVIITGGNRGIGKATAIEFAKYGATVIIASRNIEESNKAKSEIISLTGNDNVRAFHLDLGDFDSVKLFAQNVLKTEKYIDFLINNAGVNGWPGLSKYGFNKVFTVNHLGPFLLTSLFMERMKSQSKTRPVRIINLASDAYKWMNGYDFDAFKYESEKLGPIIPDMLMYSLTKLVNIHFTIGLDQKLKDYNITTYAVYPGTTDTGLSVNATVIPLFQRAIFLVVHAVFGRTPYYGAQTVMFCSLDDQVTKLSGGYFYNSANEKLLDHAYDEKIREKLWQDSIEATKDYLL